MLCRHESYSFNENSTGSVCETDCDCNDMRCCATDTCKNDESLCESKDFTYVTSPNEVFFPTRTIYNQYRSFEFIAQREDCGDDLEWNLGSFLNVVEGCAEACLSLEEC